MQICFATSQMLHCFLDSGATGGIPASPGFLQLQVEDMAAWLEDTTSYGSNVQCQ